MKFTFQNLSKFHVSVISCDGIFSGNEMFLTLALFADLSQIRVAVHPGCEGHGDFQVLGGG